MMEECPKCKKATLDYQEEKSCEEEKWLCQNEKCGAYVTVPIKTTRVWNEAEE